MRSLNEIFSDIEECLSFDMHLLENQIKFSKLIIELNNNDYYKIIREFGLKNKECEINESISSHNK